MPGVPGVPSVPVHAGRAGAIASRAVLEHLRAACSSRKHALRTRPGLPVDVLMPSDLPLCNRDLLVTAKADGASLLVVGIPEEGEITTAVFLVDRALVVYSCGILTDAALWRACEGEMFVLEAEYLRTQLLVFDVVVYGGRSVLGHGMVDAGMGTGAGVGFMDRMRHAVRLVPHLNHAFASGRRKRRRCGGRGGGGGGKDGGAVSPMGFFNHATPPLGCAASMSTATAVVVASIALKKFYHFDSAAWLSDEEASGRVGFHSDGLVFIDGTYPLAHPHKWKEPHQVTSDFYLVDGKHIHAESEAVRTHDTAVPQDASSRVGVRVATLRIPQIPPNLPMQPAAAVGSGVFGARAGRNTAAATTIAECTFNGNEWEFARYRTDKSTANSMYVIRRNVAIVAANITRARLFAPTTAAAVPSAVPSAAAVRLPQTPSPPTSPQSPALSRYSASPHSSQYYADPAPALSARRTPSLAMRSFHNHVVKDHSYRYMGIAAAPRVLELACGRGADIRRLLTRRPDISRLVAVDASSEALAEAERRWNAAVAGTPHAAVPASFEVLDMNAPHQTEQWARVHACAFDVVFCHFAVHYFADHAPAMVSAVLAPGTGVFVCTLFDRGAVVAFFDDIANGVNAGANTAHCWPPEPPRGPTTPPRLHRDHGYWEHRATIGGPVVMSLEHIPQEDAVEVWVDTIGRAIKEPLVDIDFFVAQCEDAGLRCVERVAFECFDGASHGFPASHPLRALSNLYVLLVFEKISIGA